MAHSSPLIPPSPQNPTPLRDRSAQALTKMSVPSCGHLSACNSAYFFSCLFSALALIATLFRANARQDASATLAFFLCTSLVNLSIHLGLRVILCFFLYAHFLSALFRPFLGVMCPSGPGVAESFPFSMYPVSTSMCTHDLVRGVCVPSSRYKGHG